MEPIASIVDAKKALGRLGPVVGLGVTAFPRVGILGLFPDYRILCIKESAELAAMRAEVEVLSVKRDFGGRVEKLNTLALLKHKGVQQYLGSLGVGVGLFVYRSSRQIEKIADAIGLRIFSNRSGVRDLYEDKWEFRKTAQRAGVTLPVGEQMQIDDLTHEVFAKLQRKLGERLVLQITDYTKGGGIGTFFVEKSEDLREFQGFVSRRRKAGRDLRRVNVTQRIEGESASINACVTRYGVLTSSVQRQIVDVPEVVGYHGRNGVFCGHDWGERYSEGLQRQARRIAKDVGSHMFSKGYRGIFGVDLVVDRKTDEVQMVEVNSRYTGAFPVFTMLQKQAGAVPIDVWHLLEFAGVDYSMDFNEIQRSYGSVIIGAQLILHNLERAWVAVRGEVRAGVYSFAGGKRLRWLRSGYSIGDIKRDDEFVLTDGAPSRNLRLKPGSRIGRVLFSRQVMGKENELQPEVNSAMTELYRMFMLQKIKRRK